MTLELFGHTERAEYEINRAAAFKDEKDMVAQLVAAGASPTAAKALVKAVYSEDKSKQGDKK